MARHLPATFINLAYDTARDFAGVMPIINVPLILVVSPAKYQSLTKFIARQGQGRCDELRLGGLWRGRASDFRAAAGP
jgi:hypothetical protein